MDTLIDGQEYSTIGKLDVFSQMHLARKLGSALAVLEGVTNEANLEKDKTLLTVLMLSRVSDADSEYIVKKCLSVVTRKQGNVNAKIQTQNGDIMFEDITLSAMLEITVKVIEENLGDFFRTALTSLKTQAQEI